MLSNVCKENILNLTESQMARTVATANEKMGKNKPLHSQY